MSVQPDEFCDRLEQAAAYVLGALEPGEAAAYHAHLAGCATCRRETARLGPAVDRLAASAPPVPAPPELRERVMAAVRSEAKLLNAAAAGPDRARAAAQRRPSRRRTILAGSGALAIGIAIGALVIESGPGTAERVTRAAVAASAPGAHAVVREVGRRAELIVHALPAPPTGKIYQLWLARLPGQPRPTNALFSVARDGSGTVDVPGEIRATERLMVTAEPLGGSRRPTSAPVVTATLRPV